MAHKDGGIDWAYTGAATRDIARGAQPAITVGMDAGKRGAAFGFGIGKGVLDALSKAMQHGNVPLIPGVLDAVSGILDVSEKVTVGAIDASCIATKSVLSGTDMLLESAGVENGVIEGTLYQVNPGVHAFAMILQMVVNFAEGLEGVPVSVVAAGLSQLKRLQQQEKLANASNSNPPKRTPAASRIAALTGGTILDEPSPAEPTKAELVRLMSFSAACYGDLVMHFLGVIPLNQTSESLYEGASLVAKKTDGTLYHPGWFVFKDDTSHSIVIAIRGTIRPQDAITDLMCMHETIEHPFGSINEYEVHGGMWKAATNVSAALTSTVKRVWSEENPGYNLVLTGHSLGAGVSTLLYLQWMKECPFHRKPSRCVVFAPPCTVSRELSTDMAMQNGVFSVVNRDDMVSRFGLGTMQDLRHSSIRLGRDPTIGLDVLRAENRKHRQNLFPAGRILHVVEGSLVDESASNGPVTKAATKMMRDGTYFHEIVLSQSMFSDHMPDKYLHEVKSIVE